MKLPDVPIDDNNLPSLGDVGRACENLGITHTGGTWTYDGDTYMLTIDGKGTTILRLSVRTITEKRPDGKTTTSVTWEKVENGPKVPASVELYTRASFLIVIGIEKQQLEQRMKVFNNLLPSPR